ncbi:MAG: hypothetical protein ACE5R4_11990 [Armatimonadota bacterium]
MQKSEGVTLADIESLTRQVRERAADALAPRAIAERLHVPLALGAGALVGVLASRLLAGKLGIRHGLGTLIAGAAGAAAGIAVVRKMAEPSSPGGAASGGDSSTRLGP